VESWAWPIIGSRSIILKGFFVLSVAAKDGM
jgi:hypothetical protein